MVNRVRALMWAGWRRVAHDDGQTLVEYALIIAFMSLALVAALTALREDLVQFFATLGDVLDSAGAGGG